MLTNMVIMIVFILPVQGILAKVNYLKSEGLYSSWNFQN